MNKHQKFIIVMVFVASPFLFNHCSVPRVTESDSDKPELPASFDTVHTENSADVPWRSFYSDSLLVRLIDQGLNGNFDAKISLQRIEQARAQFQYRRGLLLPSMFGGGTAAVRRYGLYTMDGAGNATTDILPGQRVPENLPDYQVGFQAIWEADISGKLRNRKAAASARLLSSMEGRNWLVTNLVCEIVLNYYQLVTLDQQLEMARLNRTVQENELAVVSAQKEVGRANELAVQQFTAQVMSTKVVETALLQQIYEAERTLNLLLGRLPDTSVSRVATLDSIISQTVHVGIPTDLLRNRPDVRQAELDLAASKADVKAARAAFIPNLQLSGSAGFQSFKPSLLLDSPESFAFTIVGGLWAPLLNRSALKAEFKSATASQLEALYNYQKVILSAVTEVSIELNRLEQLNTQVRQKSAEVEVLTSAIATSTELYRTGRATYLEVLLTQRTAFSTRMELLETRQRTLEATIRLYKTLGGGWR